MGLPDFLIVGGQRCGTGWISRCVGEHPDIFMARDETRFFDLHFDKGIDWYRDRYFSECKNQPVVGEKTANYMYVQETIERIERTLGEIKIICCLRNPINRLYSGWMLAARSNRNVLNRPIDEVIMENRDLVSFGLYHKHLSKWSKAKAQGRLLVLLYEEKDKDPHKFIRELYRFLEVDTSYLPPSLLVQTKPGAWENRSRILTLASRLLLHRYSPARRLYTAIRPRKRLEPFDPEVRRTLWGKFAEDVELLEGWLDKDLGFWKPMS
jgi:sulfotransferase family protein